MKKLKEHAKKVYDDKFQRYLILVLFIFFLLLILENSFNFGGVTQTENNSTHINIPFVGEIDPLNYSLPVLTVILGLVDGFNPCAMWVLVYLITLVAGMNDKKKVWLIVGSFVLASGILYFLFMTAWLNIFLLLGYIRPIMIIVGIIALFVGSNNLRDYFSKKELVCEVGDPVGRKTTINKIRDIVLGPTGVSSILAIIALAFLINSVEFACSAAIPAVYTGVLAQSNLSTFSHYMYILGYVFFFMLDDLIIFAMAAFAVQGTLGQKYAKYCKLIAGVIMIVLGIILLFFPGLLG